MLVIVWLFTWSLASTLPSTAAGFSTRTYWVAGGCGAAALLASLLAHELAHAIVARRYGVEVLDVTLWLFGGVTRARRSSHDSGHRVPCHPRVIAGGRIDAPPPVAAVMPETCSMFSAQPT